MIQHPVVKGFEPDADILSIHIARVPNSARHARILFQRPAGAPRGSGRLQSGYAIGACETRKTKLAHTSPWGRSICHALGRTPGALFQVVSRTASKPRLTAGPTEARWI